MASSNNTSRIVELAAQISASVNEFQKLLSDQGLPSPTFHEDSPQSFPDDMYSLRAQILDATAELNEVLTEPLMLIFKFAAVRPPSTEAKAVHGSIIKLLSDLQPHQYRHGLSARHPGYGACRWQNLLCRGC